MAYIPNSLLTHGVEIEFYGISVNAAQTACNNAGVRGCTITTDGTPNVDGEAVFAPMANCQAAYDSIKHVCETLVAAGAKINIDCGLHVHIGNALLNENVNSEQYTNTSIDYFMRTGGYHSDHQEPMDAIIVKDVAIRYAKSEKMPNGVPACLSKSRREGGHGYKWAVLTSLAALETANTITELQNASKMGRSEYSRKYSAINFLAWREGTIEFRQHQGTLEVDKIWNWIQFIKNLFSQTINNRVSLATQTSVLDTPSQAPFRAGGRIIDQYNMMRQAGGSTTRDIMLVTGCSENSVRRGATEIRDRLERDGFPRLAVIQHDQISNGHRYGDGTDLNGYEIALEVTVEGNGPSLLPDNSIGNASIWAGIPDEQYTWWQNRIVALA